jgi:hypothetical protein
MFVVYCQGHRSKLLLFAEHIEQLVNLSAGAEIHWRCTCGTAGTIRINRDDPSLVGAA